MERVLFISLDQAHHSSRIAVDSQSERVKEEKKWEEGGEDGCSIVSGSWKSVLFRPNASFLTLPDDDCTHTYARTHASKGFSPRLLLWEKNSGYLLSICSLRCMKKERGEGGGRR